MQRFIFQNAPVYNPFSGKKMKNKKTMYLKKSVPFKVFLTGDVCTFQVNDVNMDLKTLIFDFWDVSLWFKFRGIIALLVQNA